MVPALILDRRREARLRASPRRAAFFCGAVATLDAFLRELGARLVVRSGPSAGTVRRLVRETGASVVVWAASYDAHGIEADRALQAALEERGVRALAVHDAPALSPDVASRDHGGGYRALSAYLAAWSAADKKPVRTPACFAAELPGGEDLPDPARFGSTFAAAADASEHAAAAALRAFLSGGALGYSTARKVPALATSRLSAHLSFGTIAARTVLSSIGERAADPFLLAEERVSLAAFERSIARRDFFFQLAWHNERSGERALQEHMRDFPFSRAHRALEAWREGRTGFPLVDAGMRELRATGFMHPRARQVSASFLCFDLGVDWRVGRAAWDGLLVEDDPALATGNWQWAAGVGADLAQFPRIFNPLRQMRRLDPEAAYVRRWIPELAGLPAAEIFDRDARSRSAQLSFALFGGGEYPAPVVDHDIVARAFLTRYLEYVRRAKVRR